MLQSDGCNGNEKQSINMVVMCDKKNGLEWHRVRLGLNEIVIFEQS